MEDHVKWWGDSPSFLSQELEAGFGQNKRRSILHINNSPILWDGDGDTAQHRCVQSVGGARTKRAAESQPAGRSRAGSLSATKHLSSAGSPRGDNLARASRPAPAHDTQLTQVPVPPSPNALAGYAVLLAQMKQSIVGPGAQ